MSISSLVSTDLALSKRLRVLCEDYENRPYVVKRGVLETIVKFVSHENLIVATNAVEALLSLSEHPDNPTPMCQEKALLPALAAAYESYCAMAAQLSAPQEELVDEDPETSIAGVSSPQTCAYLAEIISKIVSNLERSLDDLHDSDPVDESQADDEKAVKIQGDEAHSRITSSVIHQKRTVVLDIPSLAEENVNDLERILEGVQGILSFTIDFNRHIVRLLLTTPTPTFLRILDNHGFISIILQEENVQSNNFHHIAEEKSRRDPKRHAGRGKARHRARQGCRKVGRPSQGFLEYLIQEALYCFHVGMRILC